MKVELQMLAGSDREHPWLDQAIASAVDTGFSIRRVEEVGRLGAARAKAIAESDADIIGLLDSDDVMVSSVCYAAVEKLKVSDCVGVFTNEREINADSEFVTRGAADKTKWNPITALINTSYSRHFCAFYRKAALPFLDEFSKASQPEMYLLRGLMAQVGRWLHYPHVGYFHRTHSNNAAKSTNPTNVLAHTNRLTPILLSASAGIFPMRRILAEVQNVY